MFHLTFIMTILTAILCFTEASAQTFVLRPESPSKQDLSSYPRYIHEADRDWEDSSFTPTPDAFTWTAEELGKVIHRGINWSTLTIENQSSQVQSLFLVWGDFYHPIEGFERMSDLSLRKLPNSEANTQETGSFLINFRLDPGERKTFVTRFQKDVSRTHIPLELLSYEQFQSKRNIETILRALLLGGPFILLIYNFFLFVSLRQRQHAFYCLYILLLCALFINHFSLPTMLAIADDFFSSYRFYIGYTSYELGLIAFLAYSIEFLELKRLKPSFTSLLKLYYPITCLTYVTIFFETSLYENIFGLKFLCLNIVLQYISLTVAVRGNSSIRIYAFGLSILLSGNLINLTATLGLIPVTLFTSWSAPCSAVLELVIFSFAISEKIRLDQLKSQTVIENLNQDLHKSNEQIGLSLQKLQHEVVSRNSMVEELSHRGNNPLHAANLAIDKLSQELITIEQLLTEIFGPEVTLEGDALACHIEFLKCIATMRQDMSLTRFSLFRMASAIREIRLMSEVEGHSGDWTTWSHLMEGIRQRLHDDPSDAAHKNLIFQYTDRALPAIHVHAEVFMICLERLFRRIGKDLNNPIRIGLRFQVDSITEEAYFCFYGENQTLPLSQETTDLLASLAYILSHQSIRLECKQATILLYARVSKSPSKENYKAS